jgi:hypothetical protein
MPKELVSPIKEVRQGKIVLRYSGSGGKIGNYRTNIRGPEAYPESFIDGRFAEYTEALGFAMLHFSDRSQFQILGQKHLGYAVVPKS